MLPVIFMMAGMSAARGRSSSKVVHFVRHGQATHNVRAEVRRSEGCSMEEFLAIMGEDDELDADLTEIGREQARAKARPWEGIELVVCSPLSRAIETATLIFGDQLPFVSYEGLREWNGLLTNGQRRPTAQLTARFPHVDFSLLPPTDETWSVEALEPKEEVANRGLTFLDWLCCREETEIAVVAHGGIFSALFEHESVDDVARYLAPRFGNCDVRSVEMRYLSNAEDGRARFRFEPLAPGPAQGATARE
jgi:broad specificity phosphatase PhoE